MTDTFAKDYKDLVVSKTDDYDNITRALEIVKKYIAKHNLYLVGGIAIDFALKLKNLPGIYDHKVLPDYDIISSEYFFHAYEIAGLLARNKFTGISVINALHPSTMRVRINFKEICDLTYVPKNIIECIPTLRYQGCTIVHAHYQFIDQHRALSYPYENPPYETILYRWKKDMVRYDLLYNAYPLRVLYTENLYVELKSYSIPLHMCQDQCITGFFALNYWLQQAKLLGFQCNTNFGNNSFSADKITGHMPVDGIIAMYSNNINDIYNKLEKNTMKFYAALLEKLPQKITTNTYEIFNLQQQIVAHKVTKFGINFHVANIQIIMLYLQVNYIILQKLTNKKRSYAFYAAYLVCQDIISWASKKYTIDPDTQLEVFFPTTEVYGTHTVSESYIVSKHNFDIKNHTALPEEKYKYAQPKQVFDRDLLYGKTPKKYYDFDISTSEIYNLDGTEISDFIKKIN